MRYENGMLILQIYKKKSFGGLKNTHFFSKKVFLKDKCMVFYAIASICVSFLHQKFSLVFLCRIGRIKDEYWAKSGIAARGVRKGSKNVETVLKILKNALFS